MCFLNVRLSGIKIVNPDPTGIHAGIYLFGESPLNSPSGLDIAQYPNVASVRPNLVARVGYNTNLEAGDHGLYVASESYFNPVADGQAEWYVEYVDPTHAIVIRPIFFVIPVEGASANSVAMAVNADSISVTPPSSGTIPVSFFATVVDIRADLPSSQLGLGVRDAANNILSFNMQSGVVQFDGRTATAGVDLLVRNPASHTGAAVTVETNAINTMEVLADGRINQVGVLFANLGTPANGQLVYCSDCTIANPCAGGGTGAFAKRLNGVWVCN